MPISEAVRPMHREDGVPIPGVIWLIAFIGVSLAGLAPILKSLALQPEASVRIACPRCGGSKFRGGLESTRQYLDCQNPTCRHRQWFQR